MWDALQVIHEGTNEVKRVRINTLRQDLKLLRMVRGETIVDMQKRFTHLVSRSNALTRPVTNEIATNKILRCLTRDWQSKLKEKDKHSEQDKKSVALKASTSKAIIKENSDSSSDEDIASDDEMGLFVRKYNKYLKHKGAHVMNVENTVITSRMARTSKLKVNYNHDQKLVAKEDALILPQEVMKTMQIPKAQQVEMDPTLN